jgi:uncharacterized membrane protein YhaH (DUF805 family)
MNQNNQTKSDVSYNIETSTENEIEKQHQTVKINMYSLLFSFKGRINRSTYWVSGIVPLFLFFAIINILIVLLGENTFISVISFIFLLFGEWIFLALSSKRLHDLNKSSWWLLVFPAFPLVFLVSEILLYLPGWLKVLSVFPIYVFLAYVIWNFSKLLFFKGDFGENRFGDSTTSGKPLKLSLSPNMLIICTSLIPVSYLIGMIIIHPWYVESNYAIIFQDHDVPHVIATALDPFGFYPLLKYFSFLCLIPILVLNNKSKI